MSLLNNIRNFLIQFLSYLLGLLRGDPEIINPELIPGFKISIISIFSCLIILLSLCIISSIFGYIKREDIEKSFNGGFKDKKCDYKCNLKPTKKKIISFGNDEYIKEYKCKSNYPECPELNFDPSLICSYNNLDSSIDLEIKEKSMYTDDLCCQINNNKSCKNYKRSLINEKKKMIELESF